MIWVKWEKPTWCPVTSQQISLSPEMASRLRSLIPDTAGQHAPDVGRVQPGRAGRVDRADVLGRQVGSELLRGHPLVAAPRRRELPQQADRIAELHPVVAQHLVQVGEEIT